MEEESFSCSSTASIKSVAVPDYMKRAPEELQQALLGIEEFQEKRKIIPYFAQYEFESQKQKMHDFWGRVVEQVMKKFDKSCIVSIQSLIQLFNFNGFQPMSLQKIINELVEEKGFALAGNKVKLMKMLNLDTTQEIKEEEKRKEFEQNELEKQRRKQGFLQKINIFKYFSNSKEEHQQNSSESKSDEIMLQQITEIQEQNNFIINSKLLTKNFTKFKQFLSSLQWFNNHFAFEADVLSAAEKKGMNIGEVKLFLELLEKDRQVKTFYSQEINKKILSYDQNKSFLLNEDDFANNSVLFIIENEIDLLEKRNKKYTDQQGEIKKKLVALQPSEEAQKKQLYREYLAIKLTIEKNLNIIQTLRKNQLSVEDAISNKRVCNVLIKGVATAKQNQIDVEVMQDIKEQFDEINAQEKEVEDVYKQFNSLDQQQQEELDKEMQQLMEDAGFPAENIKNNNQFEQNNQVSYNIPINQNVYQNNNNNNNNNNVNRMMDVEEDSNLRLLNELA